MIILKLFSILQDHVACTCRLRRQIIRICDIFCCCVGMVQYLNKRKIQNFYEISKKYINKYTINEIFSIISIRLFPDIFVVLFVNTKCILWYIPLTLICYIEEERVALIFVNCISKNCRIALKGFSKYAAQN